MTWIKYNNEQRIELLKNKYVQNCTAKHIIFTKECKDKSIKLLKQNYSTKEIFKKLWFPDYITNSSIPAKSLNRWKKTLKENWITELKKWRTKKEKIDFNNMTKDEELEYLRAKVAYLEELEKMFKNWFP